MNNSIKEKITSCIVAFAIPVFAQTQIYRSVQIGKTAAIATSALGSLTISGSTATFSAAMPDTLGVGASNRGGSTLTRLHSFETKSTDLNHE